MNYKEEYQKGTLRKGVYYCSLHGKEQVMFYDGVIEFRGEYERVRFYPAGFQVLAPVPTYKQFLNMKKGGTND